MATHLRGVRILHHSFVQHDHSTNQLVRTSLMTTPTLQRLLTFALRLIVDLWTISLSFSQTETLCASATEQAPLDQRTLHDHGLRGCAEHCLACGRPRSEGNWKGGRSK